ncbi:hypothetical protein C8J57DRAFT_1196106 [Mycena rebaudengoi]|nr:hypothetical protein C8J57DRAFT_1196106 [Mycena rebaudengoi]
MKVLILGATGAIGFPVAQALVRAGYIVYGLARTPAKANLLGQEEIIPLLGDVESDVWLPLITTLDVIIESVMGADATTLNAVGHSTFERASKAAQELRAEGATLLTYIYTSGIWVHGDSRTEIVTDTTPLTRPAKLVAWRPAFEQRIARSTDVNGIVVRPSLVYGRGASLFAPLFDTAREGRVVWPGTPGGRYATIHADDLAELYLLVAQRASILGGKIIDATNPHTESVDEILRKLAVVSGAKGPYEYRKPSSVFEEAFTTTPLVRPYLAHALLGWSAKKPSLIDGLETYYAAWLASRPV